MVKDCDEGGKYIFPGLDRILALIVPEPQALVSSVTNAKWLLKEEFTGSYSSVLEEHFIKIRALKGRPLAASFHRLHAILAVICK